MSGNRTTVWTIGHSTREGQELLDLLRRHGIETLVDVRRFPTSRRFPHFKKEPLAGALETAGLAYRHAPALGGHRGEPRPGSPNGAWTSPGLQAYADHAGTDEFQTALGALIAGAREARTAIMCAEKAPARCHRQVIADHLVARGHRVVHILEADGWKEHELDARARVLDDGTVVYPPSEPQQPSLLEDVPDVSVPRRSGPGPTGEVQ